jgi:hypothetical protein
MLRRRGSSDAASISSPNEITRCGYDYACSQGPGTVSGYHSSILRLRSKQTALPPCTLSRTMGN